MSPPLGPDCFAQHRWAGDVGKKPQASLRRKHHGPQCFKFLAIQNEELSSVLKPRDWIVEGLFSRYPLLHLRELLFTV